MCSIIYVLVKDAGKTGTINEKKTAISLITELFNIFL
jgi:hypothetical protein